MYAATAAARARDAAIPKPKKISKLTAILPICCLLFVAFLTASMIVLALIPLYLPHKDVTTSMPTYLAIMEYDGSIGPDGYLDRDARNAFARAIENELKLKEGAMSMNKVTVATTSGSRKRRTPFVLRHRFQRGVRDSIGIQKMYGECQFVPDKCGPQRCSHEYIRRLHPFIILPKFTYSKKKFNIPVKVTIQPNTKYRIPSPYNPDYVTDSPDATGTTDDTIIVVSSTQRSSTPLSTSTPAMATVDLVP